MQRKVAAARAGQKENHIEGDRILLVVKLLLVSLFVFGVVNVATAQSLEDAEKLLRKFEGQIDPLLAKPQPPLFKRHLQSVWAMAQSQFAVLSLEQGSYLRRPFAEHVKEYYGYLETISKGLEGDASNPDCFLKEGNRPLVLARASQTDGTLQYYMVDLPPDWKAEKVYPLYVALHGTGPDHPLAYPSFGIGPRDAAPKKSADNPIIRLTPWGRGNRGWRNDSERDLFEAIDDLKTFAKLDADRWYLTGHSAGGDGSWAIVTHTPDLWAAAGMQSGSMQSAPPSLGLLDNMKYVPFHILIGEDDNLPRRVPDSKEAYRLLKEAGGETNLMLLPKVGHYPLPGDAYAKEEAWLRQHTRKRPNQFSFTVDQSNHPGVWGISIVPGERVLKAPWPRFDVSIAGTNVHIKTQGIQRLRVNLGDDGLKMSGKVKLTINDKVLYEGDVKQETMPFDL